jgi:inorganic pyrophosphatase
MSVAVNSNYRTTFKALESIEAAFQVAYRAGCVMGFSSVGIGLGILLLLLMFFINSYQPKTQEDYAVLMELVAGYGLGGSAMALFGRVGGGIYTKAADVGADLVGKVENDLNEDSPRNPATIADNVGDNVGDVAGMGSDLFGSFAESTCAALVLIASTPGIIQNGQILQPEVLSFPLMISSAGIFGCFITSIIGIYVYRVDTFERIQKALNLQLIISTGITLFFLIFTVFILPSSWTYKSRNKTHTASRWYAFITSALGCISGLLIGISTDYYTSFAHPPVREMAVACTSGPAINVIYGLALGYMSNVIPVLLIALTILISISLLGMLGVALSAIGMLSTLAIGLAIDAYGPISDNAGGISEMSELGEKVREITDALDSAGNTTAAVGKGFAIGSAALVSLALYGAFITRAQNPQNRNPILSIDVTDPWIFCSLLIGAMLPFCFSAMTMKSVGTASEKMVQEVRRQFEDERIKKGEKEPDYQECIRVSTTASLQEMVAPGVLVIATPLVFGIFMHPSLVAGLLPGALISGVQLAISMSNTGGAWDNCKKFIESGVYINSNGQKKGKGSEEHKASIIGDTIGDPLKDTSGPSLNILIKLMAIISLVFAGGFDHTSLLAKTFNIQQQEAV